MSHVTIIRTKMSDTETLSKALDFLGYQHEVSSTTGNIRVKMRLGRDVALNKKGGFYQTVADWFFIPGITQKDFLKQVEQRYAYFAALKKMQDQGFTIVEETQQDGQIRILLRRVA